MPVIAVTMPDGSTKTFPGMSKEQVQEKIREQFKSIKETVGTVPKERSIVPEIAAMAPTLIPGEGLAMAAARPAVSAGMRYVGEKMAGGKTPGLDAVQSALGMLAGEVVGGLGRAGTRVLMKRFDTTAKEAAKAISEAVPAFDAKTPQGVFNRIIGGDGMKAAASEYGRAFKELWKKHTGDVIPPRTEIDDRTRDILRRMAPDEMAPLDAMWARAKTIEEWVHGAFKEGLLPASGSAEARALQESLLTQRAKVRQAIPDVEKILRMPPEASTRDLPGQALSLGGHVSPFGAYGYLRHLPSSPRMAQEGLTPELVAQAMRAAGVGGFGALSEQVMPR